MEIKNKYYEDDLVNVTFPPVDDICVVKLGKPEKMFDDNNQFVDWYYSSKTNGVNWVIDRWINGYAVDEEKILNDRRKKILDEIFDGNELNFDELDK